MSEKTYARINRRVMQTIFFIPLLFIAFWETQLDTSKNALMKSWFSPADEGEEDDPSNRDPEVSEIDGRKICTTSFEELLCKLPDTTVVSKFILLLT